MTVLDDVRKLVERLAPAPICDSCIADKLSLDTSQHANRKTRELSGSEGFERRRDQCSICGGEKAVIRHHR